MRKLRRAAYARMLPACVHARALVFRREFSSDRGGIAHLYRERFQPIFRDAGYSQFEGGGLPKEVLPE
jgi:hypothetical protein